MSKVVNLDNLVTREKKINVKDLLGDFYFEGSPTWKPTEYPDLQKFISKLIKPTSINIEQILTSHTPIPIEFMSKKIENQFKAIGLDSSILKMFKYKCPFNKFNHSSIIPTMFFCRDEEIDNKIFTLQENGQTLVSRSLESMIKDKKYMIENYIDTYDLEYISEFQKITIGRGYTEGCYPSDGSSTKMPFLIELESGDYVLIVMLLWCNN